MAKRSFLMLAHDFDPVKHRANGWYASEKLDGIRCFWDGGISRGMNSYQVPWCNSAKHYRFLTDTICTGLFSRYGQPILAPDFWLDDLPKFPLDGELTMGRKSWQRTSSTIKQREATGEWAKVQYKVFGSPPLASVFQDGVLNEANFKGKFNGILNTGFSFEGGMKVNTPFYKELAFLRANLEGKYTSVHTQVSLPSDTPSTTAKITEMLDTIEAVGGEGLMVRAPTSSWNPYRSYDLLKIKRLHDIEGTVIGYKFGKPTDLDRSLTGVATNKLLGLMGACSLRIDSGVEFDLTGFTEQERELVFLATGESAFGYGVDHPGEVVPTTIGSRLFPVGSKITFQYRELSDSGVPKEARYLRNYEPL